MQIGKIYCILIMVFTVIIFSLLVSYSLSSIPFIIQVEMFWQLKYSTFMQCFERENETKWTTQEMKTTQVIYNCSGRYFYEIWEITRTTHQLFYNVQCLSPQASNSQD